MEIKIPTIEGLTLKTKGTYVEDDISITIGIPHYKNESQGVVSSEFDRYLSGELTEIYNDHITYLAKGRFDKHTEITAVSMPNLVEAAADAFAECTSLKTIYFPKLEKITSNFLEGCSSLDKKLVLPSLKTIGGQFLTNSSVEILSLPAITKYPGRALYGANKLTTLHIPNATSIDDYAFYHAHVLKKVVIEQENAVCTLASGSNVFKYAYHFIGEVNETYNPEGLRDGVFYVPDNLVNRYKAATNWSVFADQIKPLSEYVEEE